MLNKHEANHRWYQKLWIWWQGGQRSQQHILFNRISDNDNKQVELLLPHYPINSYFVSGDTPLTYSVICGITRKNFDITALLLRYGADPNKPFESGLRLIQYIVDNTGTHPRRASEQRIALARLLVLYGADTAGLDFVNPHASFLAMLEMAKPFSQERIRLAKQLEVAKTWQEKQSSALALRNFWGERGQEEAYAPFKIYYHTQAMYYLQLAQSFAANVPLHSLQMTRSSHQTEKTNSQRTISPARHNDTTSYIATFSSIMTSPPKTHKKNLSSPDERQFLLLSQQLKMH